VSRPAKSAAATAGQYVKLGLQGAEQAVLADLVRIILQTFSWFAQRQIWLPKRVVDTTCTESRLLTAATKRASLYKQSSMEHGHSGQRNKHICYLMRCSL